jgi:ABC-type transport system involved in multi-copper enzyme maturation permease subunit
MPLGPILGRELLTLPRKPRGHGTRVGVAVLMAGALAANYYGFREYFENHGHFSLSQLTSYARSTFFSLAGLQFILTLTLVPGLVSPSIAEEKERKTLHYLLASRLGSGEIILGKLAARMLQYLVALTAGVPIFLILTLLGGFQPEWVFALYVMTLAMAYFLGGMSIFASTISKRTKQASNLAGLFAGAWFVGPIVLWVLRAARLIPRPLQPVMDFLNTWLFDVSPTSLFAGFAALAGSLDFDYLQVRAVQMIGLQFGYGTLFILLSILLLRPAYRRLDNPPRRLIDRLRGVRTVPRKHPAIGRWPVLWKECHTAPPAGIGRFFRYFLVLFLLTCLCVGMFRLVSPVLGSRFGFAPLPPQLLERHLEWINNAVRYITAVLYGFAGFLVAGSAATMISSEKERDTWDGLIGTRLEPKEIVLQKMAGAIYQQRWLLIPIAIVWTSGLVTGGLSPWSGLLVGFEVAIFLIFASAIGFWSSLLAKGTSEASSWAGGILLLVNVAGPLFAWSIKSESIWYWTLCSPMMVAASLFHTSPTGVLSHQDSVYGWIVCILGLAFYASAGAWITWDAIRRFDSAVGRPRRSVQAILDAQRVDRGEHHRHHSKDEARSLSDVS